jgi:hypothetical protein
MNQIKFNVVEIVTFTFLMMSCFEKVGYSQRLISLVQSSNNVYQAKPKKQCFITFYPSFHNKQKLPHSKCYISRTNYPTAFKFVHVPFEGWC